MGEFNDDSLTPVPIPGELSESVDEECTVSIARPLALPDPSEEGQTAHLIVIHGAGVGQVFPLAAPWINLGRGSHNTICIRDRGISREHATIVRLPDDSYLLRDAGSRNGTYIGDRRLRDPHAMQNGDRIRLGTTTVLKFLEGGDPEADYALAMYEAAMTDCLTGVFNRRYLEVRLEGELAFARRHRSGLAVMLLDLDHFKRVNDEHGHLVGDHVLEEFATLAKRSIRAEDILARYGGEEFAIVVRLTEDLQFEAMARRIQQTVAAHVFLPGAEEVRITVSIGLATYHPDFRSTPRELLDAADRALLRAKELGRNRVELAKEATAPCPAPEPAIK